MSTDATDGAMQQHPRAEEREGATMDVAIDGVHHPGRVTLLIERDLIHPDGESVLRRPDVEDRLLDRRDRLSCVLDKKAQLPFDRRVITLDADAEMQELKLVLPAQATSLSSRSWARHSATSINGGSGRSYAAPSR